MAKGNTVSNDSNVKFIGKNKQSHEATNPIVNSPEKYKKQKSPAVPRIQKLLASVFFLKNSNTGNPHIRQIRDITRICVNN
jgi:hypothetical protein